MAENAGVGVDERWKEKFGVWIVRDTNSIYALVAVCVQDQGPGVAPEIRRRLFERFVHGPSDDGAVQPIGTGLGLAIV